VAALWTLCSPLPEDAAAAAEKMGKVRAEVRVRVGG